MWNNPHLLIMDEPTNYLDRVSGGGNNMGCSTAYSSYQFLQGSFMLLSKSLAMTPQTHLLKYSP